VQFFSNRLRVNISSKWRLCRLFLTLLVINPGAIANAQTLEYDDVDLATVRILTVKGVRVQDVPVLGSGERTVAIPNLSHGTGIAVSHDGLILTAHHVVDNSLALAVKIPGSQEVYPAKVLYADPDQDFAFITTNSKFAKFLPLSNKPRNLRMREQVNAIGYPIDASSKYPLSSPGIIAGELPDGFIQLGMSLNPGNSGGPVIDSKNQLVAIVVARGDPAQGVLGLGLAVPLFHIVSVLQDVVALNREAQSAKWSEEDELLAAMAAILVETGPAGMLREVSKLLRERDGSPLAELRLKAVTGKNVNLSVLAAAYLWDAIVMLTEDQTDYGDEKEDALQTKTRDYLRHVIELCHAAVEKDPNVSLHSTFVSFVVDQWPRPKSEPVLGKSSQKSADLLELSSEVTRE
jgi:hypothetical protein